MKQMELEFSLTENVENLLQISEGRAFGASFSQEFWEAKERS